MLIFRLFPVPEDFHLVLKNYTRKGYRVIAAAFRPLPASINYTKMQRLSREEVESDLILLGLIVLENKLKPETTPVISKLKDARLRIVIVTGKKDDFYFTFLLFFELGRRLCVCILFLFPASSRVCVCVCVCRRG